MIEARRPIRCKTCRNLFGELGTVATSHAGSSSSCTNSYMIWMAVAAIGSEGNNDIGAESTDNFCHLLCQHFRINFLQHAITVIQANHMLDSKSLAGEM